MAATATAAPSTLKITATQGILAMKGSGKTYRAMAQAEEMLDRGAHVVAIDPTGAWWGLRYAASDTSKVLYPQLALLGGDKGSIDLLDSHGTVVARAVVEKKMSCVLDLSRMSKAGMRRFVAAFLLELFRTNPNRQIHLFIDEADLFAPQHAQGEAATVAGAMSDVVRRGRKKGIGVTMISQRPQALSTDVRNQCDVMTLLRVKGTHDLDAIEDWLDSNGFPAKDIRAQMPKLRPGDFFFCGLSDDDGELFKRESTHRKSYDSGRTPEEGDEAVGLVAAFDADTLRAWLGDAADELAKNDPKELQQQIRDLEAKVKELEALDPFDSKAHMEENLRLAKDVEALQSAWDLTKDELAEARANRDRFYEKGFRDGCARAEDEFAKIRDLLQESIRLADTAKGIAVRKVDDLIKEAEQHETPDFAEDFVGERKVSQPRVVGTVQATPDFVGESQIVTQSHEANELGNCEYRILSVLKRGTRDRESLAILSVYSATSGGFGAALAGLRKRDLIHGGPEGMFLTAAGQKAAPNDGWPLIRGSKLLEAWRPKLGKCENQILHALTTRGPMLREVLAKHTAYSPTSGGFGAALAVLRKLGLIKNEGKLLASNRLING